MVDCASLLNILPLSSIIFFEQVLLSEQAVKTSTVMASVLGFESEVRPQSTTLKGNAAASKRTMFIGCFRKLIVEVMAFLGCKFFSWAVRFTTDWIGLRRNFLSRLCSTPFTGSP